MHPNVARLVATPTIPEGVDAKVYRLAENIYVLYSMTRDECREYIAKQQAAGVDAVTLAALEKLFHLS